jgi:hypothetical protein
VARNNRSASRQGRQRRRRCATADLQATTPTGALKVRPSPRWRHRVGQFRENRPAPPKAVTGKPALHHIVKVRLACDLTPMSTSRKAGPAAVFRALKRGRKSASTARQLRGAHYTDYDRHNTPTTSHCRRRPRRLAATISQLELGQRHDDPTRQHTDNGSPVDNQTAPFEQLTRRYPERVSGDHAERAHVASTTAKIASVTRPIGGMTSISTSNPLSW